MKIPVPNSVAYWSELLSSARQSISHALHDCEMAGDGFPPVYHLDFSLLAPILFTAKGSLTKPARPGAVDAIQFLTQTGYHPDRYHLTVSGATYFEFLDRLNHQLDFVDRMSRSKDSLISKIAEGDFLAESSKLVHDLSILTKKGLDALTKAPIDRFLELLDSKVITGIGDHLDPSPQVSTTEVRKVFEKIYSEQRKLRLERDIKKWRRKQRDAEFHYKMDAASLCLSLFYSTHDRSKAVFVTESSLHLNYAAKDDDLFARHFYTPLHLKNLSMLQGMQHFRDAQDFLLDALHELIDTTTELEHYDTGELVQNLPHYVIQKLIHLRGTFLDPLLSVGPRVKAPSAGSFSDDVRALLSDTVTFQASAEEAKEEIRTAAKKLGDSLSDFGEEYLYDFGLEGDPIVKRINERFSL